jgi:Spy/CpxP family protein refolding chaperone
MKKSTGIIIAVIFTALALAIPAGAQFGRGMSDGMKLRLAKRYAALAKIKEVRASLTIEQRDAIRKLRDAFLDETVELRKNIRKKSIAFRDLLKSENPGKNEVMAARQELMDLRTTLFEKKFELRQEQLKIIKSNNAEG